jgi:hypothetical protein
MRTLVFIAFLFALVGCGENFPPDTRGVPFCSQDFVMDYNQVMKAARIAIFERSEVVKALSLARQFKAKYGGTRCVADVTPISGGVTQRKVLDASAAMDELIEKLGGHVD